jgi:hypothetical protein
MMSDDKNIQAHSSHHAFYVISVRQTEGLLPASFRFGLATDTLACSGLAPPSYRPCRAHMQKAAATEFPLR